MFNLLCRPCQQSTINYVEVAVTRETTAEEIMSTALEKFKLESEDINNFVLTTVQVDKAIIDRKLALDEQPFNVIQTIAKVT